MSRGGFVNFNFNYFFDRAKVIDAVERANKRNLSKAGAFIRTAARSSIRKRKAISEPGSPPSSHTDDRVATLRNILFAYEPMRQGVVVGPVGLNAITFDTSINPVAGTVPELLEFGGRAVVIEERVGRKWYRRDLRRRGAQAVVGQLRGSNSLTGFDAERARPTRARPFTVAKRPYMEPAMLREASKFPDLWADSVR